MGREILEKSREILKQERGKSLKYKLAVLAVQRQIRAQAFH